MHPVKSNGELPVAPSADDAAGQTPAGTGTVTLRGLTVALDSDVGELFVIDCARNVEGLLSEIEIQAKYELSQEAWERLADNARLLQKVRAEHERRVLSGECAREAAQRHFAKAPNILNGILTDEQVSPRHRIEAARELRQAAGAGPDAVGSNEKITIRINLGADEQVFEKNIAPLMPLSAPDEGDV
jgi:hypothetical protein